MGVPWKLENCLSGRIQSRGIHRLFQFNGVNFVFASRISAFWYFDVSNQRGPRSAKPLNNGNHLPSQFGDIFGILASRISRHECIRPSKCHAFGAEGRI
jgi:hypothetical protein